MSKSRRIENKIQNNNKKITFIHANARRFDNETWLDKFCQCWMWEEEKGRDVQFSKDKTKKFSLSSFDQRKINNL
jgi:hypothetical protein